MEQELELLLDRAQRLMDLARKLSDENANLRQQLELSRTANQDLQSRMDQARSRVETALARLPIDASTEG